MIRMIFLTFYVFYNRLRRFLWQKNQNPILKTNKKPKTENFVRLKYKIPEVNVLMNGKDHTIIKPRKDRGSDFTSDDGTKQRRKHDWSAYNWW